MQGKSSSEIPSCLGYNGPEEVVHRANISLLVLSNPLSASQSSLDDVPAGSAADLPMNHEQTGMAPLSEYSAIPGTIGLDQSSSAEVQRVNGPHAGMTSASQVSPADHAQPSQASSSQSSSHRTQSSPLQSLPAHLPGRASSQSHAPPETPEERLALLK